MKTVFRWLVRLLAAFVLLSVLAVALYRWVDPPVTPLMVQRAFVSEKGFSYEHKNVPLGEISVSMVQAVVAGEDNLFLKHNGFDIEAMKLAYSEAQAGKRFRGGSTISQQCAKNVFLLPHRSYFRKGLEAYFTFLIEKIWGKRRIMEVYLNVIEFGDGIYGVEAAARHYFRHSAKTLTHYEASMLAAALPSPRKRNPARPSRYMLQQSAHILRIMRLNGPIDLR